MTEIFAVSTSGHDKNKLYVIVGKDVIKNVPEEIRIVLKSSDTLSDLNIKRAIKLYLNAE